MDQSSALPNLVSFADPRGKPLRSMLYRSFVVFGFEMADTEDLIGMVHELSAVAWHWLSRVRVSNYGSLADNSDASLPSARATFRK